MRVHNPFAFPMQLDDGSFQDGMTLRDYFAAAALQGMLAHDEHGHEQEGAAELAYTYADAMLDERERER